MKYALLAACVAAFAWPSAQVNERREAPVAPAGQTSSQGQRGLLTRLTPQKPETSGRSSSGEARSQPSALEEMRSAAEARRVREAVSRTLERVHELSRAGLD